MTDIEAVKYAFENKVQVVEDKICMFHEEYRFLSNMYLIPILYDGIEYKSTEHAYQAHKTVIDYERKFIANLSSPYAAKKAAQTQITIRADWAVVKYSVMLDVCTLKFQDPELKQKLKDTNPYRLIEGCTWKDTYWGVDHNKGGKNHLGQILMHIREYSI